MPDDPSHSPSEAQAVGGNDGTGIAEKPADQSRPGLFLSPATKSVVAPSIGWALMLVAIFVAASSVLGLPFTLWRAYREHRYAPTLADIAFINAASFALTVWIGVLLTKRNWHELLSSKRPVPSLVPASLAMAMGMAVVCSEIYNVTLSLIPMPEFFVALFAGLFDVKANPVMGTLALVVVAPVAEEFLCRRWLLEGLLQRYHPAIAIIISGVAFGIMHLNPWQFFYATALGLGIGWLYWRTRSVFLCMLWHGLNNSFAVLFAYWNPDIEGFRRAPEGTIEFHPAWLNGLGLCLLLGSGLVLWLQTRRNVVAAAIEDPPVPQIAPLPLPPVIPLPAAIPPVPPSAAPPSTPQL